MISIIILTKNEESDLPTCLTSVKWSDDVHILDSGSTDETLEIAKTYGAKVWSNAFESFGKQRNFALDHISTQHDWILFLDADEVVTDEFRQSLLLAAQTAPDSVAGFYCCWKLMLDGRWLKYCDNFPKWQFRVLRKNRARFTDFGHGQKESQVMGDIGYISEPYLHFGFSKGWTQWIDRHNKYSGKEAAARLYQCPPFKDVVARHASTRNLALKSWLSKFPGWPLLRFLQAYILNLGFLEGVPGLIYCINNAYYEFMIQIKMREFRAKNRVSQQRNAQDKVFNPSLLQNQQERI